MTLTKNAKKQLRARIFRYLDGIVCVPTAFTLYRYGIFEKLADLESHALKDLTVEFKANEGYLNVALRIMCSQGWMSQEFTAGDQEIRYALTPSGKLAIPYLSLYEEVAAFIPEAIKMEDYIIHGFPAGTFMKLKTLFQKCSRKFDIRKASNAQEQEIQHQIAMHLEGAIAGPLIVSLGISGLFNKYFTVAPFEVEEFTEHHNEFREVINFFESLGWFTRNGNTFNFTPEGVFFAKRAGAYGVTVSYLPTFMRLNDLLFGNPGILWDKPANTPEIHVNRRMNVWGSGAAHSGYFTKVDEIILDIFNKPIHEQPKGFIDMGCGDGTLLVHIFEVIYRRTLRGKLLDEYPLFIIGADYNEAALSATRNTLNQADIWAKVVWGDIGQPDMLADNIKSKYELNLEDLLHVRSFLDHNRIYQPPEKVDDQRQSKSTGAFAFRGEKLSNNAVEENLINHFKNWMPYVKQYGLLVIELHTIPSKLVAKNLGNTPATAYDATHGFSDQYILELDCFLEAAAEAGLFPDTQHQYKFPNSDLATVSINILKSKEYL
ncbi:class I SAM-dependent methyltransferase [Fulvivirgaceae bacterium BMA12]|uniref:Class I SAM-dependent methyltransferase n=1 Tax=Agaribacillus aureus TaxID=3051825 RepID=A0ABT8L200_9BACT|nr:class I SAM-dependent methyltransferase [Fulvivirgaceae bacterium BMA12]